MSIIERTQEILESVCDPEVPVLSVIDLGIIRETEMRDGEVIIKITPTYTGCPAMQLIEWNIHAALDKEGIQHKIVTVLSPPWTTDWMSEKGKLKLKEYGIAPPSRHAKIATAYFEDGDRVICPRCNSKNTSKVSEFGSTACKALYQCKDCLEPFDYFKCH